MATTSTIGTARAALVTAVDEGELAGKAHYAWPGNAGDGVNELWWIDKVTDWTQQIANIKAGRPQRQESYTFETVLWVANPEGDADSAQETLERALVLAAVVENAVADDVQIGTTSIQWVELEERDLDLIPFGKGWGCQIISRIRGHARLT